MYCDRCGADVGAGSAFCSRCGKAFASAPPVAAQGRVAQHVRLVAYFWIALSALRVLPGLFVTLIGTAGMHLLPREFPPSSLAAFPPELLPWIQTAIPILGGILMAFGAIGIVAGWGLLTRQSWARILVIVLAFLNLPHVPFGTALGIYTLWVLLPARSEQEYKATAQTA